nr:YdeI/OmpD-associated family protein [Roseburia sp. MSJ-14]
MSEKGFVIDKDILSALQANAEVWKKFLSFPPLYQRVRIDTIQIKKKQPELFQSRLQKLLDNTEAGIMYGEWNDNGRLLKE